MNVSFIRNAARSDKDGYASDTRQQEYIVTFHLCTFGAAARGKTAKELPTVPVPPACLLDPDGDLVRRLRETGKTTPFAGWPCYHTELDTFPLAGQEVGIVGRVVGASFAVLVAEELFASGCRLLVSLLRLVSSLLPDLHPISLLSIGLCVTKGQATIMPRRPNSPWLTHRLLRAQQTPPLRMGHAWSSARPGRRTRRFARRLKRLRRPEARGFSGS